MSSSDKKKPAKPLRPATEVVHSGRDPHACFGFVNPPVYRGSTVLFPTVEKLWKRDQPYAYGRTSTPTVAALEEAMARVEGGAASALTASGYQAVSTAIFAFVEAGDHILMTDSVYQPTRKFCDHMLKKLGVETTYYDPLIGADIDKLVRPNTRLIFTESPGSQTFEVQDIPAIAKVCAKRKLWLLLDNTWASPLYFRPFEHGVDVSIQAATKYVVGHADAMLGAITSTERAAPYIARSKDLLGVCPGSEETYLGLRGLRTLATRLAQHQRSAIEMAEWLEARPEVARVLHPALPSHPQHAHLEARLPRRDRTVRRHPEADRREGSRGHARRLKAFRHGVLLGRLREPRHSLRPDQLPDGDALAGRGASLAFPYRARGRRGLEGGPRGGLCAPRRGLLSTEFRYFSVAGAFCSLCRRSSSAHRPLLDPPRTEHEL